MQRLRLSRREWGLLLALAVVGLALRLWHLDFQSLWRDETDAIRFATQSWAGLVQMFRTPGENGPLYFLALRGWLAAFGTSDVALRAFSVIPGVLLIPACFFLAERMAGKRVGFIAAGLAALSPFAVWYSQEGKMYAWLALLGALQFTFLWIGLTENRRWAWAAYAATMPVLLLTHYLTALLIPAGVAVFLVGLRRWRQRTRAYLVGLGLVTLPYFPFALWQLPVLLSGFRTGHPFVPFNRALSGVVFGFTEGVRPLGAFWALAPFLLALLAAWALSSEPDRRLAAFALTAWWIVPFGLLFAVSLQSPMFTERYLITTLPAFLLLLAVGLDNLALRSRVVGVVAILCVAVVSARGVWVQATRPIKPDMRAAAAYLCPRIAPDDAVVFLIPHVQPVFERYCDAPGATIAAPYTNDGALEADVAQQLEAALQGRDTVWLVESEAYLWDERGLVRAALEAGWTQGEDAEFEGVRVRHYGAD